MTWVLSSFFRFVLSLHWAFCNGKTQHFEKQKLKINLKGHLYWNVQTPHLEINKKEMIGGGQMLELLDPIACLSWPRNDKSKLKLLRRPLFYNFYNIKVTTNPKRLVGLINRD